jgi:hypothetical protein
MIRNAITAAYAAICSTLRRSITGTGPMPLIHIKAARPRPPRPSFSDTIEGAVIR